MQALEYRPSYHDLEVTYDNPATKGSSKATVHYVEAGDPKNPKFVLWHGYPSSSHQYRDLIPMLADKYHLLAPDYPGFGYSKAGDDYEYTFASITAVMAAWLKALNIKEAAIFIQDFGAPVGLRLAVTGAYKPTAIVTQNGNAYEEGLGPNLWTPLRQWFATKSEELGKKIGDKLCSPEATKGRWVDGTPEKDRHLLDPTAWELSYQQNIAGPVQGKRMLSYIFDYRTNIEMYPEFQKYIREQKPPILAVWGERDDSFIAPGAKAFLTDQPETEVHYVDGGHFALESQRWEMARLIREFLPKHGWGAK